MGKRQVAKTGKKQVAKTGKKEEAEMGKRPDYYCGIYVALIQGLCAGVLELARCERERLRRRAARNAAAPSIRRSLNPAPAPSEVSAQWSRTKGSLLEILRFGSMLMDLEPTVDSSPVLRYNAACTHKVIVARNPGIKGWLHRHCREIGYRTALRYKNLAESLRKYCGLPADTPLEWAFPDQSDHDAIRRRKTPGDLDAARAKLAALLAECPNVLRLQTKLDVLLSRPHRSLAKPRKPFCANARRRREERAVETLLRTVRARAAARLPNQDRETRGRLLRGLLHLAGELQASTG